MPKDTFNMRNPDEGEVQEIHRRAKQKLLSKDKYHVLSQLLSGKKEVDVTVSPAIFEALNRERMEFTEILKLHPDQVQNSIKAVQIDRAKHTDGKHWNPKSPAKWGCLGHIPPCVYYSRPTEYWEDKKLIKNFFNTFTKFRVSTKSV